MFYYLSNLGNVRIIVFHPAAQCKQRTTEGDCCVFPFVYKNKCYTYCIDDPPWCGLTDNFDRDAVKGYCLQGEYHKLLFY